MKRTVLVVLAALLAGGTLSACKEAAPEPDPIEQGIRCSDAGGDWLWSDWTGYHCEFHGSRS